MALTIKFKETGPNDQQAILQTLPDICPLCEKSGQPDFMLGCSTSSNNVTINVTFRCPVQACRALYIASYKQSGGTPPQFTLVTTGLNRLVDKRSFPRNIENTSPLFCTTYNQAMTAELNGLDQICGPGYRKALEFLVKDYLVGYVYKEEPEKSLEVKKSFLAAAIGNHIDERRIKECAKRAAWLGNDEVHYTRKWEDKDINDLKSLVLMTVNYIDLTMEADRYLSEMPA